MMNRKVGLVLGSGAARGWAHIGIINGLKKLGIEPDIVVGCSMGSLIGAGYAAGQFQALNDWAHTMDSWRMVKLLDWGGRKGGLVSGEKVFNQFRDIIGDIKVEDCPIPFATCATDLYSGREHWLQEGSLIDAVRASCAMPGMLAPHYLDDTWLIDGAVVNPVPVSLCRALGATHVIAVNLNANKPSVVDKPMKNLLSKRTKSQSHQANFSNLLGSGKEWFANLKSKDNQTLQHDDMPSAEHDELVETPVSDKEFNRDKAVEQTESIATSAPNMLGVIAGSIDIMQDRITRSRLAGDPPDILIQPELGHIGILEFNRASEIIELGEQALEPSQLTLKAWADHKNKKSC